MISFIKNVIALAVVLAKVSKYRILQNIDCTNLPLQFKTIIKIINFLFYPISLLHRNDQQYNARLTDCLKELGPAYIKLGQTLSTRPDLIGNKMANSLRILQDNLPPFSTEKAKKIIASCLKKEIDQIFSFFPTNVVVAASIAQVYKAQLITGEDVAVKVLRPNVQAEYFENIETLNFIAKLLLKFLPKIKRLKLLEVIDILRNSMINELDMRIEAASYSEMLDNLKSDHYIYIPKVYWEFTTEKVLTVEWINGVSIRKQQLIMDQSISLRSLSEKIILMFFNQAYRDGFFHADLHHGNILVLPDGKIGLVDFGIIGRLSEKDRIAVAEILYAFLERDYKKVAQIHLQAGYIPQNTNLDLFSQYCRSIAEPIIGLSLQNLSLGKLLAQLFMITETFGMETQPQLLLLQKTMIVVEGISRDLNPEINIWELMKPWMKKWAVKNISIEARLFRLLSSVLKKLVDY
ncbi:2-polyprenylphenol 6-hydroxylase [Orientia chuto str. Dubai]|uniref:2-polyprenylphenol 6-hydroxylase n=1 Tax=Orientia chuto str. Dubai TaxID=1359168 RepID=A0A0F3MJD5_9RICK|nr:2-polyprenylphenol 6-hydroxylase [Candidatus Orientia mediorientalis]KJV55865.1 2-polyprenylphenol 6-hydroxylase [Orientia chuto str. Dubai]